VKEYVEGSISSATNGTIWCENEIKIWKHELLWIGVKRKAPFKGYPGEEAVLEMAMFDLNDLVSSLKLLM